MPLARINNQKQQPQHFAFAGGVGQNGGTDMSQFFQPIQSGVGIPNADVNFIQSPSLQASGGNGIPKPPQKQQQPNPMQEITQGTGAANGITSLGGNASSGISSLWNGSSMSASDAANYNSANGLTSGMDDFASAGDTSGGMGDMLSSLGSSLMEFFHKGGRVRGLARGGATKLAFGGAGLPDIISGVGDIIGAFYGDPGAGSQATGMLSSIDGGKTEPGLQLRNGGALRRDDGGNIPGLQGMTSYLLRHEASETSPKGLLGTSGPGRTDNINTNVPAGSYIVPADVVSGLGEGNTMAGANVLDKMMHSSPHDIESPNLPKGGGHGIPRPPEGVKNYEEFKSPVVANTEFAKGGTPAGGKVPVVLAGGEFVVHPEDIKRKFGDLYKGHRILDQWVQIHRKKIAQEMLKLPAPVGAKKVK